MKYRFLSILAMLCMAMPAFVSCNDDDDDDDPALVDGVIGTYTGSLGAQVMNIDCPMEGKYEVSIWNASDADEVRVVLPKCAFAMPGSSAADTIPSLTVYDVDVKASGNSYILDEDDFSVTVNGVVYTGSINGTVSGKNAKINYVVKPGRMPMPINFAFDGSR